MTTHTITRRPYKNTGLTVPLLGFGAMRLPKLSADTSDIDYAQTEKLFAEAIQAGCNYFDTAYMYHDGKSETCCGDLLANYPRAALLIADKMPVWMAKTTEGVQRVFQDQLRKTRAGYFDFYLVHALDAGKWQTTLDIKALDFLQRMKQEGLIRHLGFSFHDTPDTLRTIADAVDWDFAQIQLNYLDWDAPYRAGEQYQILTERHIPVIVMEPVRGGTLAQLDEPTRQLLHDANPAVTPASWALRFAASLPNVLTVLSGMSNQEQLLDNIRTFSPLKPLDDHERRTLALARATFQKTLAVPCTACKYCVPCPAGVAIPDMFRLYNQRQVSQDSDSFKRDYHAFPANEQAGACVACGLCREKCPQHIDIPAKLATIAAEAQ